MDAKRIVVPIVGKVSPQERAKLLGQRPVTVWLPRHGALSGRRRGFIEVHVAAPLEVCEKRDPKGFYAKARRGEIAEFTGVSAPYEAPESPDLVIQTAQATVKSCVQRLFDAVMSKIRIA